MESNATSFTTEDLSTGRVIVMIDALDEIADDVARSGVIRSVVEFHEAYPNCKLSLTSRDYAFVKAIDELERFTRFRFRTPDMGVRIYATPGA